MYEIVIICHSEEIVEKSSRNFLCSVQRAKSCHRFLQQKLAVRCAWIYLNQQTRVGRASSSWVKQAVPRSAFDSRWRQFFNLIILFFKFYFQIKKKYFYIFFYAKNQVFRSFFLGSVWNILPFCWVYANLASVAS